MKAKTPEQLRIKALERALGDLLEAMSNHRCPYCGGTECPVTVGWNVLHSSSATPRPRPRATSDPLPSTTGIAARAKTQANRTAVENRCDCGHYCEGPTRTLHAGLHSGIAAVVEEVMMAQENCPDHDDAALASIVARIEEGRVAQGVSEWFSQADDDAEARHLLPPEP